MRTAGWTKLSPSDGNAVLESARLAPSVHNSRPWRIRQVMDGFELYGSPDWWLPGTDPDLRELRMSCGAALLNMRLALAALGFNPYVRLQPDPGRQWLLAVVRAGQRRELAPGERPLVDAIPKRRTSRSRFLPVQVPVGARHALRRAAETESSWLTSVEDPALRRRLRGQVLAAHRAQLKRPDFVAEWRGWTGLPDGVAGDAPAAGDRPGSEPDDDWVLRELADNGHNPLAAEEPMIAVLGSYHDRPAGRAGDAARAADRHRARTVLVVHRAAGRGTRAAPRDAPAATRAGLAADGAADRVRVADERVGTAAAGTPVSHGLTSRHGRRLATGGRRQARRLKPGAGSRVGSRRGAATPG